MNYSLLNAICYEICRVLIEGRPSFRNNVLVKMVLEHCFQDWVEWKTQLTMQSVDKQTEEIQEQWKEEENKAVVEKFQDEHPEAKVTLHNDNGAVLIEHPPDGSKAQDLLGGTMEIKSPWSE